MTDISLLVLRLGIGIMFAAHGLQKAFGVFGGSGVQEFSKMLGGMGFPAPIMWAYLAAYVELLGGIALVFGIFPRLSSGLLLILIVVAAVKVHMKNGFFMMSGGFEYNFVIASVCIALLVAGAGKFSIYNKY